MSHEVTIFQLSLWVVGHAELGNHALSSHHDDGDDGGGGETLQPPFSRLSLFSAFQVRSPSCLASPTSVTCSSSVPATACTSSQREPPPPPPPSSENRAAMLTTKTATMTESTLRMMRMRTTMTTAIEIFASSKTGKPRSGELRRRDIQREKETQPRVFIFIRFKSYFVR